jgi:phosphoglycolate phosphatase
MIRAIIFDFDGTLAKLTLDKRLAKENILRIASKYIDPDAAKRLERHYVVETIYAIEEHCGASAENFRQEAFHALSELELAGSKGKDVFPFTREVLRGLRQSGMKLGILSRSCRPALKLVFPDVDQYVDVVSTRDDTRYAKPHPSHMRGVLSLLKVDPSEAVYVGDQRSDIETGKTANVRTIAVLTGGETRGELEAARPDHIVSDIRELHTLI